MKQWLNQGEPGLILEELEQRQLLSAGLEGVIDTQLASVASATYVDVDSSQQHRPGSQADSSAEQAGEQLSHEIVVIDSAVEGYQAFIDDIYTQSASNRHIEVVVLDSQRDGIEQISSILQQFENLDALHIIAHGSDGSIQIGNGTLDGNTLQENRLEISLWANSFSESGDILIYGCNLAESETGKNLINNLSDLTLADVAASDDLTGHFSQGGDWMLEYHAGLVDSDIALSAEFQAQYRETLATYTVTSLADSGAGTLRQAILDANSTVGIDTIEFGVAGTISLQSALPGLDDQITIDATTAPGYTDTPRVFIDGSSASASDGLVIHIGASGSIIKGLGLYNFNNYTIWVNGASNVTLQGNSIGLDASGNTVGSNGGIFINAGASNNLIGGDTAGAGNVITNTGTDGIYVNIDAGSANAILGNSIFGNTGLAIDLATNGVNVNDAGDADTGANDIQNFPLLAAAGTDGSRIAISGSINSTPNTTLRIEFFANAVGDVTGYGEGQNYLGYTTVVTDSNGDASFVASFDQAVANGQAISATATVINADASYGSTSEFSANVTAQQALIVDTTSDVLGGNTSSVANLLIAKGADGLISLREAIIASNNTAGQQTIFLAAGDYTLSLNGGNEDLGMVGDLDVTGDITILGAGAGLTTIDASSLGDRVFDVRPGGSLTLKDLTIANGSITGYAGGGIYNAGTLVASDVVIRGNTVSGSRGGALFNGGNMSLERVSLFNNSADNGGALEVWQGVVNMTNVTISGNTSLNDGGGIRITSGTININHSTVAYNSSTNGKGGGLHLVGGTANISNSIFANNSSNQSPADVSGAVTSNGYNIFVNSSGFTPDATDQSGDPVLSVLIQDASSGQYFHAITGSSIANNTAGGLSPITDQLGTIRELSADIGAYEYIANIAPQITSSATVNAAENQTAVSTVTATDADGDPISYSISGGVDSALFSITSGGILSFNSPPDFENPSDANSDGVYQVQVTADDGKGGTAAQLISVSVTNVNEAPSALALSNSAVDENTNTSSGYSLGTLSSSDVDLGDSFSYSIVGGADAALFSIGGVASNELILSDGILNFENKASYQVTVRSTDAGGLSHDQSLTITVNNLNEAPTIDSLAVTSATQDIAYSYSLSASDVDGDALSFSATTLPSWLTLTDNGNGSATLTGTPGNAEVGNHNVVIEVSDGALTATQSFTISVSNVNDAPQITSSPNVSAAENQTAVSTVTATDVDGDPISYSITGGADSALFSITSGGIISFNSAPDFENPADANSDGVYQVQVTASDGNGGSAVQLLSVTVSNVNEAPSALALSNSAVDENTDTSGGYSLGTLSSSDVDTGDSFSYSIVGGADAALFSIGGVASNELILSDGILNFENKASYQVTVRSTDAGGLSHDQSLTITVNNLNEAPTIDSVAVTSATQDIAYSYSLSASDVDGDALSFSATTLPSWLTLTDNGNGSATLTGTPGNAEVGNHNVVIEVSDGALTATQSFTISVSNVNDAPQITSSANVSAAENQTAVSTLTATDVDGDPISYSITGGADSALFSITSGGILSFNSAPDFENPADANSDGVYQVQVTASDGNGGSAVQLLSVTVSNVNEAPSALALSNSAVDENTDTSGGYSLGILSSSDVDQGDSFSYSIVGGADAALFSIGGVASNELILSDGILNFENQASYQVIVRSTDAGGLSHDQSLTITVNNLNEAPTIDSVAVTSATQDIAYSYSLSASDVDGDALSFSAATLPSWLTLTDNGNGSATLTGTPGNAEVGNHNVVIEVSDGALTATQSFTISVSNVNDAPQITSSANVSAAENQSAVSTVTATDVDGDPISYSITGGADSAMFSITSGGILSFNSAPDFENPADANSDGVYQVQVTASDGNGGSAVQLLSVTVSNVNEAPSALALSNSAVDENTDTSGGYSLGTLSSSDVDLGDSFSYSIVGGADAALFSIGGVASNELILSDGILNFENQASYQVTVRSTDAGGLSHDQSLTITVNNLNEAPTIDSLAVTSATQDIAYSYSLSASDVDGDALSFSATTLPSWLTLTDNGNGSATLTGTPGNAEVGNHNVVIEVSDGTLTATQSFTISVSNVNDAPQITSSANVSAAENQTAVSTVTATDVDGDPISYSITGGADSALFSISSGGVLSFNSAPDFESPADANSDGVYQLEVTASDGNGGSVVQLLSVTVSNVNEAPVTVASIYITYEDIPLRNLNLLSNASDIEGDTLSISGVSAQHASVSINADNTIDYIPDADFHGEDLIRYIVDDGNGGQGYGSAIVMVNPVSDVNSDTWTTLEGVSITFNVLANDSFAEGATLDSVTQAPYGNVTFSSDGTITYTPIPGYIGSLSFSYSVKTSFGDIETANVTIIVQQSISFINLDIVDSQVIDKVDTNVDTTPSDNETVASDSSDSLPISTATTNASEDIPSSALSDGEDKLEGLIKLTDENAVVRAGEVPVTQKSVNTRHAAFSRQQHVQSQDMENLLAKQVMSDLLSNQLNQSQWEDISDNFDAQEEKLLGRINEMQSSIEQDMQAEQQGQVDVQVVLGSTAGITVGIVGWVLRGGSLLASMMTALPLVNRFDPLPIIKAKDQKKFAIREDNKTEGEDESRVANMFVKGAGTDD